MASSTQDDKIYEDSFQNENTLSGDEVVISGISGLFPKSVNVAEFMDNLYNNVDMVEPDHMNFEHPEMPKYRGKISGDNKFDPQFFRVTHTQAVTLEPMCRKLLEQAYSAIFDAGINPLTLKGKKIGVFTGATNVDSAKVTVFNPSKQNGFIISGGSRTMLSNRISFWLDGKGPSYTVDSSCSSVLFCLQEAYNYIKSGICDAAIVSGTQLCYEPLLSINLRKAGFLSLDGKTRCFDKKGDGCARSETISVLFLQRARDAKRIYAEVYHTLVNYGLKPEAPLGQSRTPEEIKQFLEEFYSAAGVSINEVEYVEAHGAALPESDANELEAIGQVFGIEKPIMVGCVKSNMGNSEAASGACALTKLCLAYHRGKLPANLNCDEPVEVPALKEGKVELLKENACFGRGFTAINNFSFSGNNCHVLLKGHYKPKDLYRYSGSIPRMVLVAGRQEESIVKVFDKLNNQPIDPELFGLLNNIYQVDTPGFTCRGYTILDNNKEKETMCLSQSAECYQGVTRPLWLVFSGMGSQWAGMGTELMRIPIFAAAIQKCQNTLEPFGVDVLRIITEPDNTIFNDVLNCFVGIAAVQIGLIDMLKEMEIVPDNIIGHSVGEMACAYFDNCFTAEEFILAAYSRGQATSEVELIKGSMAAIGIGYEQMVQICPPEIDIACRNSSESCTISGPADVMKTFVAELVSKGVFAKEVPCGHIAYHSRYIQNAGPILLRRLNEVVKNNVLRSEKWISTSVPTEKWDDPLVKYSSPQYHTNNLLSPVYFEEAAKLIPPNAVIVEVAPHGLMQAILKRSHPECTHIPLTRRGIADPVKYFLEAIGKIYQQGYNPKVDVLYPKIQYPVSTETSLLSHYVDWYHEDDWYVAKSGQEKKILMPSRKVIMSVFDEDFKYFIDHVREGNIIFPEAAMLVLLWETLAMYKEVKYTDMSVVFSDIHFHSEVIIDPEEVVNLSFVINKGNDYFEVTRDDVIIVSGYIVGGIIPSRFNNLTQINAESKDIIQLDISDIYNIMSLKGHSYSGEFKSISSLSHDWQNARVNWSGNWVTFLDSLIQLNILSRNHEGLSVPTVIRKLTINITEHIMTASSSNSLSAEFHETFGVTRCGGVEIRNMIFDNQLKKLAEPNVLQTLSFVPHEFLGHIEMDKAFLITSQIWFENTVEENAVIVEINSDLNPKLTEKIKEVTINFPHVNFDVKLIEDDDHYGIAAADLIISQNILMDLTKLEELYDLTKETVFIMTLEDNRPLENKLFNIVSVMMIREKYLVLLNKIQNDSDNNVVFVPSTQDAKFDWLPQVQKELEKSEKLILISDRQAHCGLLGFVKKMRMENKYNLGLVVIEEYEVPESGREREIFNSHLMKDISEQLKKRLTFNILKQGKWGGYYYLPAVSSVTGEQDFNLVNDSCNLDGLKWTNMQTGNNNNNIQVHFAGPSVRDIKKAVGVTDVDTKGFGMDYSGVDCKGNKVMGLIQCGTLASSIRSDPDLLWPVPGHWTLQEAATVPLPYVHAFYCLTILGQLKPSHTVFVNGGTGAFGQAVISICLSLGCNIFTCVSDVHKKRFLRKLYPKLDEKNIGYSNDDSFFNAISLNTKGKRCDFVINCTNGASRELAMKCVGFFGLFMDISACDLIQDNGFGMWYLEEDKTYKTVDLRSIFKAENVKEKKFLQTVVSEGIVNGAVKPTSYMTFTTEEVSRAFRLISLNKHRGRVLINIRDSVMKTEANIIERLTYSSEGTYLVVCDETIIGVELVKRLLLRGVKNIILHLKSMKLSGYLRTKILQWQKQGVNINISTENLQLETRCSKLFKGENVTGIFYVKPNTRGSKQEDFVTNRNVVVSVVSNLDVAAKKHCPDLRHFVVLSQTPQSVVDEYSTSVLEKICAARAQNKLPALLFRVKQLDIIEPQINCNSNILSMCIETMLNALETSLKQNFDNVLTFNVKKDNTLFLANVAKILGLKSLDEVNENLSVKDIIMNDINVQELRLLVKENNGQDFSSGVIKNMSIAGLKKLSDKRSRRNTQFDAGLNGFYGFVEQDENIATEVFVTMPTLLNNHSIREYESVDPEATHLMMVPGFEGHNHIFSMISERLKIQATAVQLGPDVTIESIEEIAIGLTQVMKKHFKIKSKFYLLGYSFGVNVALEIASILEKDGHTGVIFCLDSSPDALKVQIDAYLNGLSDVELQDAIIEHLFHIMSGQKSKNIRQKIDMLTTFEDKVDVCLKELKEFEKYTTQYKRDILNAAYKRIVLAKNYNPKIKLNSEIVLLKGISHPKAENLTDDYNLSKYTTKPVKVNEINSDFISALEDCRVANIINQSLDPELLAEFKTKNLCDCYFSNIASLA